MRRPAAGLLYALGYAVQNALGGTNAWLAAVPLFLLASTLVYLTPARAR